MTKNSNQGGPALINNSSLVHPLLTDKVIGSTRVNQSRRWRVLEFHRHNMEIAPASHVRTQSHQSQPSLGSRSVPSLEDLH